MIISNVKKSDFLAGARERKHFSKNSHNENNDSVSLRQTVFTLLNKNPLLTAKPICKLIGLPYRRYGNYINDLKYRWKSHYQNEQGSKCSLHGWRGWCYLPVAAGIRTRAVTVGWVETRARNRWLLWRDRLGRLQWFETGRVNLYVHKPANLGKAYQLVCNGFSFTGLITDIKILEAVLASVRFKGAHYVFPTGQRLPRFTIDLFAKSNGVIIKVGDLSHPHAVEVIAYYPDWAERNEQLLEQLNDTLQRLFPSATSNNHVEKPDYVR
jgi:hypothetical protein